MEERAVNLLILLAIEPRSYRDAIGQTIQILHPRHEVVLIEPSAVKDEVIRLDPDLVIAGQPNIVTPNGRPIWVEYRPYGKPSAKVCIDGKYSELDEVELSDLLSVVDQTERLARINDTLGGC